MLAVYNVMMYTSFAMHMQGNTVSLLQTAHDGATVMTVDSNGKPLRVQVPQGFDATNPTSITTRNRGLVMPPPTLQELTSMQVHLHHSGPNAVAISWTTPTALNCAPKVFLDEVVSWSVTQSGATRSYPGAYVTNKTTAASFQHVVLTGLQEGKEYNYSVRCAGLGQTLATFAAPISVINAGAGDEDTAYTFAIFGDMGITPAAHDTVKSLLTSTPPIEAVFHIGDLSYARGNEAVWNQFFGMIEPVASRVPWSVAPGNHDKRSGDSNGECGLPMLSRFETPRSRAAQPHLLSLNDTVRCAQSFDNVVARPFWYALDYGHARIITYSTDTNLTKGSAQYNWLAAELAHADLPASRATHPWLLLMGHKPMYTAATYSGEIKTRGNPHSGEGTEGMLTAELEELWVDNNVDVSLYGHIHSYNRMYPVKANGSHVEKPTGDTKIYRTPTAPVHMMIGMAGAGHLEHNTYETPAWSAFAEISYGWLRATFANASALHLEFVANGDGVEYDVYAPSVHDDVWITK